MELQVDSNTKFKDLQKKFSKAYPFLKIEFYKKPHAEKELSEKKDIIEIDKTISNEAKFFKPATLKINEDRTVAEIEKEFFNKFGIAMQVSRKQSNNVWIETSRTDYMTLKRQNEKGREMSLVLQDNKEYENQGLDTE
jgi:glycerol-3-phosphate O-acyltransferase